MDGNVAPDGPRFVIVGCGNIGSRALQSLLSISLPMRIDVVEPDEIARRNAVERAAEVASPATIRFVDAPAALEGPYDLGIVATDSRSRRAALFALLDNAEVAALVLEKVLYPVRSDYEAAGRRLTAAGVPAFVNTTRNVWPVYLALRETLRGVRIDLLEVDGGDWSLACNAVHFLSLAEFLTGEAVETVAFDEEPPSVRPSKRPTYQEVLGVMTAATTGGTQVRLASRDGGVMPPRVRLEAGGATIVVDERTGTAVRGAGAEPMRSGILLASQLGGVYADIAGGAPTTLPTHADSSALHLKLIAALNEVFYGDRNTNVACPVT